MTGVCAAYWAHSPVLCITPAAATLTKGLGGFQEVGQLPIFHMHLIRGENVKSEQVQYLGIIMVAMLDQA